MVTHEDIGCGCEWLRRVSIPQSGFLVVTPGDGWDSRIHRIKFQSLSRDSWWSHSSAAYPLAAYGAVSIPQSGFLVVTHSSRLGHGAGGGTFQSLSRDSWWSHHLAISLRLGPVEFQSLSRDSWWSHHASTSLACKSFWFQSLSRDSWWSHVSHRWPTAKNWGVSIPQSGFLVVTPRMEKP